MRYRLVLPCFLLVLAACTMDDGTSVDPKTATARAGQDIELELGSARLFISGTNIGSGAGQIPEGSRVKLSLGSSKPAGYRLYSPVVKVEVQDDDGKPVEGIDLDPPASLELLYDRGLANEDGVSNAELSLLRIRGNNVAELNFTTLSPAADTQFTVLESPYVRATFTALDSYAVSTHKDTDPPPPSTALTGTVSALATSTVFQLADAASAFSVNLLVRTADTLTPPTLITLNDAAFNAANPFDPNNRLLTVQTGGNTYTSDSPTASVVVQIDTFTATSSSGSMIGTLAQQGGAGTLQVNFTFTTGSGVATALGGAITDAGGRRTIALSNATGTQTLLLLMPDTLPDAGLAPIQFNDAAFDSGDPFSATSRLMTLTDGADQFTSDLAAASATVTFTDFDTTDLTGTGTITGTLANASPATRTLNYTFTIIAGSDGGPGSLDVGTAFDITTTDVADECAVASDGTDYIVAWLSDVGTTNRTLEYTFLDGTTLNPFGAETHEPGVNLDPAGGFGLAANDIADTVVVGATGADAATSSVWGIFFDPVFGSLYSEINLGTGTRPLVQYHYEQDLFVIAWQSGLDVHAGVFEFDGTQVGTTVTVFTAATLAGLAAPGDLTDEALVTARDGSGVRGRLLTVSTGAAAAAAFDISTAGGGGACSWDAVDGSYLVMTEQVLGGFFTVRQAVTVQPGAAASSGDALPLPALEAFSHAAWGSDGAVFITPEAGMFALESGTAGPTLLAAPVYGNLQGGLALDTTPDGPAIASLFGNEFVLVSARGAGGVHVQPLTLSP